jgi:hypothetical protein
MLFSNSREATSRSATPEISRLLQNRTVPYSVHKSCLLALIPRQMNPCEIRDYREGAKEICRSGCK